MVGVGIASGFLIKVLMTKNLIKEGGGGQWQQ